MGDLKDKIQRNGLHGVIFPAGIFPLLLIMGVCMVCSEIINAEEIEEIGICLEGPPEEVGKQWARINSREIIKDVERFIADSGLSPYQIVERGKTYLEITEKLAPWWLIEAAAVAKEVGIDPEVFNAYQGAKYRGVNLKECSSYFAVRGGSRNGNTLFHKSRHNRYRTQGAYYKKLMVKGKKLNKYFSVGDVHDMFPMMFVNEKGLAGAADAGAPKDPNPRWKGWMNHVILRYIAEIASDCSEALEIIKMTTEKGICASGNYATRWTFADKSGNGFRAVQFANKVLVTWVKEGFLTSGHPYFHPLVQPFFEEKGPMDVRLMNEISRHAKIGNRPDNLCSFTAEISKDYPEFLTCTWVSLGRASHSVYIPLFVGANITPISITNGKMHSLNKSLEILNYEKVTSRLEDFERTAEKKKQAVEQLVVSYLREGQETKARTELNKFVISITKEAQEYVTSLNIN